MHLAVSGYVTLAILLLLVGGMALMVLTAALARLLLRPPRLNDARGLFLFHRMSPGDLDLKFEEMRFVVSTSDDEKPRGSSDADRRIALSAWWIPAAKPSDVCVILLHGYSDSKIGAIAWAPMLHSLGLHILAIDLRAHGESGGRYFTGGYFERHDISQVIDQLQADRPRQSRRIVLFGINAGATVAAAVAELRQTTHAENHTAGEISALILDGAFPDFRQAVTAYLRVIGSPGRWLHPRVIAVAQRVSHSDFASVNLTRTLPAAHCPLMLIENRADRFVNERALAEMQQATAHRPADRLTVFWMNEGPSPFETGTDVQAYAQRLAAFLTDALTG